MKLVQAVYDATDEFRKPGIYGLAIKFGEPRCPFLAMWRKGKRTSASESFLQFRRHSGGSWPELDTPALMAQRKQVSV